MTNVSFKLANRLQKSHSFKLVKENVMKIIGVPLITSYVANLICIKLISRIFFSFI